LLSREDCFVGGKHYVKQLADGRRCAEKVAVIEVLVLSGILREPRTKKAWRPAFCGLNLTEGTPNGECRFTGRLRIAKFY